MKAEIIRIGNSQGIRIPKLILEQCNLKGPVDMQVKDGTLVIAPANRPREGWEDAFAAMAAAADDKPVLPDDGPSEWDEEEWDW